MPFISAPGLKRKDSVLLRRNGSAVSRSRTEMPVLECGKAFCVDIRSKTLQHSFVGDFAALVDRDFDDLVARYCRTLPRVDVGVRRRYRQRRADLVAV